MLRHIILMKVRAETNPQEMEDVFKAAYDLKKKVPGVMGFSYGSNIHESGQAQGYTHVMMMDFVDRDYYNLFHDKPEYIDIKQRLADLVESPNGLVTIDYPLSL